MKTHPLPAPEEDRIPHVRHESIALAVDAIVQDKRAVAPHVERVVVTDDSIQLWFDLFFVGEYQAVSCSAQKVFLLSLQLELMLRTDAGDFDISLHSPTGGEIGRLNAAGQSHCD